MGADELAVRRPARGIRPFERGNVESWVSHKPASGLEWSQQRLRTSTTVRMRQPVRAVDVDKGQTAL